VRPIEPLLALAYGKPRSVPVQSAPRKILVIRRNGIGDMICALPLLRHLRAAFPLARLDVLAGARSCATIISTCATCCGRCATRATTSRWRRPAAFPGWWR
jgi:hypothetical protein